MESGDYIRYCRNLSDEELEELRQQLIYKAAKIQLQLDLSTSNDQVWARRCKTALKYNSWRLGVVQSIQAYRRREAHKAYSMQFLEAAKALLPQETFNLLHAEATDLADNKARSNEYAT